MALFAWMLFFAPVCWFHFLLYSLIFLCFYVVYTPPLTKKTEHTCMVYVLLLLTLSPWQHINTKDYYIVCEISIKLKRPTAHPHSPHMHTHTHTALHKKEQRNNWYELLCTQYTACYVLCCTLRQPKKNPIFKIDFLTAPRLFSPISVALGLCTGAATAGVRVNGKIRAAVHI